MSLTLSPAHFDAVILDLDGVVTDTAHLHVLAWRHVFNRVLLARGPRPGEDHQRFSDDDYRHFVAGRPRCDGAAAFLASRGVVLPWGAADDPESAETVCGLGNRKDSYFSRLVVHRGVPVFAGTVVFVRACRAAGLRTAVVSASRSCAAVLAAGGVQALFDVCVDGVVGDALGLPAKPDPAIFLEAAQQVAVCPERAIVVADAEGGVIAARQGGFALVLGVDHTGHAGDLLWHGADRVVTDLSEVSVVCSATLQPAAKGHRRSGPTALAAVGAATD
jgi:alpha,alpha-trehalase